VEDRCPASQPGCSRPTWAPHDVEKMMQVPAVPRSPLPPTLQSQNVAAQKPASQRPSQAPSSRKAEALVDWAAASWAMPWSAVEAAAVMDRPALEASEELGVALARIAELTNALENERARNAVLAAELAAAETGTKKKLDEMSRSYHDTLTALRRAYEQRLQKV
jgi:hypothetical protein